MSDNQTHGLEFINRCYDFDRELDQNTTYLASLSWGNSSQSLASETISSILALD